jgi:peptide subunit release factor 1 (eRF1)
MRSTSVIIIRQVFSEISKNLKQSCFDVFIISEKVAASKQKQKGSKK